MSIIKKTFILISYISILFAVEAKSSSYRTEATVEFKGEKKVQEIKSKSYKMQVKTEKGSDLDHRSKSYLLKNVNINFSKKPSRVELFNNAATLNVQSGPKWKCWPMLNFWNFEKN